jgi:hypothetical protein
MPPNPSARLTPVLLSDQLDFTIPSGAPNFWAPDPSRYKTKNEVYEERIGFVVFCLVAFFWLLFGIYLVVMGNLRDRKLKAQAELLEGLRISDNELRLGFDSEGTTLEGSPGSASKVGLGTKTLSQRKSSPRGLDRFREFDDRWFRE